MPIHYSVTRRSDGWVISADGVSLLLCSSRKVALRTIRDAVAQEGLLPSAGAIADAPRRRTLHRVERPRDSRSDDFPAPVALSSCS